MAKLTVVVSQGQSASPAKRQLEEDIVAALLFERGVEVTVIPHLYDLAPDGTGVLCLQGITGHVAILSWLYPRAARWILARNGVKGHEGQTLLELDEGDDDEESEEQEEAAEAGIGARDVPNRRIYCLDLRASAKAADFVAEVARIRDENSVQTVSLMGFLNGSPSPAQVQQFLQPGPGNVHAAESRNGEVANGSVNGEVGNTGGLSSAARQASSPDDQKTSPPDTLPLRIEESAGRRWYPVIDFSRCTNCLECLDFCLFGVYGVDKADTILVEQPDNCRKGCPACSRVCPANAIIFPQHKTPTIAGSPVQDAGAFKIDLSKLFGAPEDSLTTAVAERDEQLLLAGREAVGMAVGIPKRQEGKAQGPKDDLDGLVDALDSLEL